MDLFRIGSLWLGMSVLSSYKLCSYFGRGVDFFRLWALRDSFLMYRVRERGI